MKGALIIPCYNFASGIVDTVREVVAWNASQATPWQVYFVDDGSTDHTNELLSDASRLYSWCHVLSHQINRGKGAAVRTGYAEASKENDLVFFTDCDLHYGLAVITDRLRQALDHNDIVILDRSWSEEARYRSIFRRLSSQIYNRFVSILTGVNYKDTQAGLKGFKVSACSALFKLLTLNGFAFDVEVLSIASYYRFSIAQVPIEFRNAHVPPVHSTVHLLMTPWKMVLALLKINWNWKSGRYKDRELEERINRQVYVIAKS